MIYLGIENQKKQGIIERYCLANNITKVVILTPEKFAFKYDKTISETVYYPQIIEYKFFYRLLQEISQGTLIIINECLRTQNRHDLTYNCIRHYLTQTKHKIIFQYLPIIDTPQDFMTLFDFDTQSRWKREKFDIDLLQESEIVISKRDIAFNFIEITADDKLKSSYQAKKQKLFAEIGIKDPHTLPRNLYLIAGKAKLGHIDPSKQYLGRNNRFKIEAMHKYKQDDYPETPFTVFELPHNFIDYTDFLALSAQDEVDVLATDIKADQWYCKRYQEWKERLDETYTSLFNR